MQTQKETVRRRILAAAEAEFLDAGFHRASVRRIAAAAGVAVGNIYAYFPGKAALFDAVVAPALEAVRRLFKLDGSGSLEMMSAWIADAFLSAQTAFRVLMERAEGTSYEGAREGLIASAAAKIQKEYLTSFPADLQTPIFAEAMAGAVIGGMFQLLQGYNGDEATFRRSVAGLVNILFAAAGAAGL